MTSLFIEGYFPNAVITATSPKKVDLDVSGKSTGEVDIEVILNRNFFDAKETKITKDDATDDNDKKTDVKDDTPVIPKDQKAVKTSLSIKLLSTISVGDGRNAYSSAVIKGKKKPGTYTIKSKESFAPNTRIVRVLPKKVEFLNNDRLEYVELDDFAKKVDLNKKPKRSKGDVTKRVTRKDDDAKDIKLEGDVFKIPRKEIDRALANISKLYTDVRAVPYYKDGKPQGFKLLSVKRGSLFQKLGLRRGDILKSVNGTMLDIQTGMNTFNSLKNESEFQLELERRGEEKVFKYEII